MRKKTVNFLLDNILWYFIYMLPFLVAIFNIIGNGLTHNPSYTADFWAEVNLFFSDNLIISQNPIFTSLYDIFGDLSTIFPFIIGNGFFEYFVYFGSMLLLHFVFDVIVFIPRLAHKFLSKALKE